MTTTYLTADYLFDGKRLRKDHAVKVVHGRVAEVVPLASVTRDGQKRHAGHILTPTLFDIQVNGGGGAFLNTDQSPEGIRTIAAAHRKLGTGRILPTLITDAPDVLDRAAEGIMACHGKDGICGFHIEGPHLSVARKGTHKPEFIRPLDDRTFAVVRKLRDAGVPVLITVAPESVTPGQVSALVEMGAKVSIGHSDATFEEARALEAEGASLYTHLYNAMSPMLNRAPGVTGAAITSESYCSVICDGIHAKAEMLKIAIAARPMPDRMIIVSDAMPTVGGPDSFEIYGQTIKVSEGRLINAEGSLAGAHTTMVQSVGFAVQKLDVPLEDALRMALTNPARAMDLPELSVIEGVTVDDLLVIDAEFANPSPVESFVAA